jgi:hypothetical protein
MEADIKIPKASTNALKETKASTKATKATKAVRVLKGGRTKAP